MSVTAKNLCRDEFFYGHKACAGCGGSLAVRNALKVLGKNAVAVLPAGCMSAVGFNFPQLCFANNAIISTFAGTASMLTGIEAGFRARGIKDFTAVGFAAPFAVLSFYRGERDGGPLLWNRRWDFKTFFAVCEGGRSVRAGR